MTAKEARKIANPARRLRQKENEKIVEQAIEKIDAEIRRRAEMGEFFLMINFTDGSIFEDYPEYEIVMGIEARFNKLGFKTKFKGGRIMFIDWRKN